MKRFIAFSLSVLTTFSFSIISPSWGESASLKSFVEGKILEGTSEVSQLNRLPSYLDMKGYSAERGEDFLTALEKGQPYDREIENYLSQLLTKSNLTSTEVATLYSFTKFADFMSDPLRHRLKIAILYLSPAYIYIVTLLPKLFTLTPQESIAYARRLRDNGYLPSLCMPVKSNFLTDQAAKDILVKAILEAPMTPEEIRDDSWSEGRLAPWHTSEQKEHYKLFHAVSAKDKGYTSLVKPTTEQMITHLNKEKALSSEEEALLKCDFALDKREIPHWLSLSQRKDLAPEVKQRIDEYWARSPHHEAVERQTSSRQETGTSAGIPVTEQSVPLPNTASSPNASAHQQTSSFSLKDADYDIDTLDLSKVCLGLHHSLGDEPSFIERYFGQNRKLLQAIEAAPFSAVDAVIDLTFSPGDGIWRTNEDLVKVAANIEMVRHSKTFAKNKKYLTNVLINSTPNFSESVASALMKCDFLLDPQEGAEWIYAIEGGRVPQSLQPIIINLALHAHNLELFAALQDSPAKRDFLLMHLEKTAPGHLPVYLLSPLAQLHKEQSLSPEMAERYRQHILASSYYPTLCSALGQEFFDKETQLKIARVVLDLPSSYNHLQTSFSHLSQEAYNYLSPLLYYMQHDSWYKLFGSPSNESTRAQGNQSEPILKAQFKCDMVLYKDTLKTWVESVAADNLPLSVMMDLLESSTHLDIDDEIFMALEKYQLVHRFLQSVLERGYLGEMPASLNTLFVSLPSKLSISATESQKYAHIVVQEGNLATLCLALGNGYLTQARIQQQIIERILALQYARRSSHSNHFYTLDNLQNTPEMITLARNGQLPIDLIRAFVRCDLALSPFTRGIQWADAVVENRFNTTLAQLVAREALYLQDPRIVDRIEAAAVTSGYFSRSFFEYLGLLLGEVVYSYLVENPKDKL